MRITVPTSLADITLGTYLKYEEATDPESKVATLLNIDVATLRRIEKPSLDAIDRLLSTVQGAEGGDYPVQPIVTVNGLKMGLIPDLHRISLGEFADLETLCRDAFKNLPKICAILYRPVTDHSGHEYAIEDYTGHESSTWALDLPMDAVLGMLGFFLSIGLEFSRASVQSLKEQVKQVR